MGTPQKITNQTLKNWRVNLSIPKNSSDQLCYGEDFHYRISRILLIRASNGARGNAHTNMVMNPNWIMISKYSLNKRLLFVGAILKSFKEIRKGVREMKRLCKRKDQIWYSIASIGKTFPIFHNVILWMPFHDFQVLTRQLKAFFPYCTVQLVWFLVNLSISRNPIPISFLNILWLIKLLGRVI